MSARYRLTLAVEFTAGDDSAARSHVSTHLDTLSQVAMLLRTCAGVFMHPSTEKVKLKLQRLNDDAPPRALVVETL